MNNQELQQKIYDDFNKHLENIEGESSAVNFQELELLRVLAYNNLAKAMEQRKIRELVTQRLEKDGFVFMDLVCELVSTITGFKVVPKLYNTHHIKDDIFDDACLCVENKEDK